MSESNPGLHWIRYSESQWASKGNAKPPQTKWRVSLAWDKRRSLQKFELSKSVADIQCSQLMAGWKRFNQHHYIFSTDILYTLIPEILEPDDCIADCLFTYPERVDNISVFLGDAPDKLDGDIFQIQQHQNEEGSYLEIEADIPIKAFWCINEAGHWRHQEIFHLKPGTYQQPVTVPLGDHVFLLVEGFGKFRHVHKIQVTGKPGISSGRSLWHRGTIYHPRGIKNNTWSSILIPVFHVSDIERFPRNHRFVQMEWWIEDAQWSQEARYLILELFPNSNIRSMGPKDSNNDIIILKPYELNEPLDLEQVYAVSIFEDSGQSNFGERIAWTYKKLCTPAYRDYKFIEHAWFSAVSPSSNPEGNAQYGVGFSFTRMPQHEHLWGDAVRNIYFREDKESLPCHSCTLKNTCKQWLPTSYQPTAGVTIPWKNGDSGCIVLECFKYD